MTRSAPLLPVLLLVACGGGDDPTDPDLPAGPIETAGFHTRSIHPGLHERSYRVYVPTGLLGGDPAPALLVLHGNPPVDMEVVTEMSALAEEHGFYAVYPESAFGAEWMHSCPCTPNANRGVDDDRYFEALLDDLDEALPFDSDRAFVSGFSNGGMMTYGLACRMGDRFAGFGAVGSGMWRWLVDRCPAAGSTPIVMMQGTDDPSFPWEGLEIETALGARLTQVPIEEHVAFWAERNGCSAEPSVEALPDQADDGTTVDILTWVDCDDPTVFYRIEGGGHTWPGMPVDFGPGLGRKSLEIEASEVLVEFFLGAPAR